MIRIERRLYWKKEFLLNLLSFFEEISFSKNLQIFIELHFEEDCLASVFNSLEQGIFKEKMLKILSNLMLDAKVLEALLNRGILESFTQIYLTNNYLVQAHNVLLCIQRFSNSLTIKLGQWLKEQGYPQSLLLILNFLIASDFKCSHLSLVLEALKNYLYFDRQDEGQLIREMEEGETLEKLMALPKRVDKETRSLLQEILLEFF